MTTINRFGSECCHDNGRLGSKIWPDFCNYIRYQKESGHSHQCLCLVQLNPSQSAVLYKNVFAFSSLYGLVQFYSQTKKCLLIPAGAVVVSLCYVC